MCSFFLVWKRRHVSPTYTVFWQVRGIFINNAFLPFTKRLLTCAFNLFNLSSRLESNSKRVSVSSSPELRRQPLQIWYGHGSTTFLFFLLSFVYLLGSLFHNSSDGFSGVSIRYKHVRLRCCVVPPPGVFHHIKPITLSAKPFIMALFILSGRLDLFFTFMFVWVFL